LICHVRCTNLTYTVSYSERQFGVIRIKLLGTAFGFV
jgi:hypothetical protein